MKIQRRSLLKLSPLCLLPISPSLLFAADSLTMPPYLGQGTMCGEVTDSSAFLQTRLTAQTQLDANGDLPGLFGVVCFEWATQDSFVDVQRTRWQEATSHLDFIVRMSLNQLKPNTVYFYRAIYGVSQDKIQTGPTCSFKTLAGNSLDSAVTFIVGSCMNYNKFMYGKSGKADGPLTATDEDKQLGFPAFDAMVKMKPDFFIGTGDIVYYDNPRRVAGTVEQLRQCWHEQFRFPRMIEFFRSVPTYWSKDDHDFRYNDSDNLTDRLPLPKTGIDMFREQLPMTDMDSEQPTYRTHRVNKQLQIWLSEGRDYRSPNKMADGPGKSLWGAEQFAWLKQTLLASDAKWKILVTPTPMVGPDDAHKTDNHTNLDGFQHEANAFFAWLKENNITNFITMCGDRHWQYHSIHPSGVEEFACGALNDENARMGVPPGSKKGTDPESVIKQLYTSPTPNGGFLRISAGQELVIEHYNSRGKRLYGVKR